MPANDATTAMASNAAEATIVPCDSWRSASMSRMVSRLTATAMIRPRRIGRAARAASALFMRSHRTPTRVRALDPRQTARPYSRLMPAIDATDHVLELASIEAARERLAGRIPRTPVLHSSTAARWTNAAIRERFGNEIQLADGRLYLKADHLQTTGSFKVRGMTNRILTLDPDARARGAITLSAGNAGQAYAWAGASTGVPVTVVMPEGAVRSKVDACLDYGARVVLHGTHVGDTFAEMERLRDVEGLTFVHPFDDPEVIAGHGTLGLELVEDVPDVDVVVVAVGGGGLISGVAAAVKAAVPGVASTASNRSSRTRCHWRSSATKSCRSTRNPWPTVSGGRSPGRGRSPCAAGLLDGIVLLDDPTILAGMRFALERLKQVLEPAGAAALAAVLAGQIPIADGERVAVVLSGGNVEVDRIGELIAGAATLPGALRRERAGGANRWRSSRSPPCDQLTNHRPSSARAS